MIERPIDTERISSLIASFPVTAILGARQVGKSTLAKSFAFPHYFDLENPRDLARLDQPLLALERLGGTVVIDEIQRKPDLFPLVRYLVDQNPHRRFLVLGSASKALIRQSSESLAGRIAYYELGGFNLIDVGLSTDSQQKLWVRGTFPRSFLATSDAESLLWRDQFIQTFLERDIPQLGIRIPSATLGRFWKMIAHYQGQLLNYQELARSFSVSDGTVRHYLEILEGTFMVRLVQPWFENRGKRLVKAPKLYIQDSGIFHALQNIPDWETLEAHPKLGASWEGFVLDAAIRHFMIREPYFYRTHSGTELDLFWEQDGKRIGMEIKYADAPRLTPSMKHAREDLDLDMLLVIYPGDLSYKLDKNIVVLPFIKMYEGLPAIYD
ncbi:MAG TPA: ATP-binding protein [Spirochaetales bacterium]|nr:ATP-binding protein [Spirochaetales bacterium]